MDILTNAFKAHAGSLDRRVAQPRLGVVASVRADKCLATVRLQPGNHLTGWLPILTQWIGHGWGMACPPSPGDQVLVIPQEGYYDHGLIVGYCRSDLSPPPNAPSGEYWLVHKSGTSIKLANDGKVHIKGDLHVDGDIFDRDGSLDDLRQDYLQHRHRIHNGTLSTEPVSDS